MIFPKGNSSHHLERMGEFLQSVVKIKKERLYSETSRYFIKELSDDEKVGQLFFMPQCVYVCSGKGSAVIFLL